VDDVCLVGHAEVSTEGAGGGLATVGDARHGAEHAHGINAADAHHYYRGGRHRLDNLREEGLVDQVGVMLAQNLLIQLHHLHAADNQTLTFDAGDDLTHQEPADCRRLEDAQCLLHFR